MWMIWISSEINANKFLTTATRQNEIVNMINDNLTVKLWNQRND